MLGPAPSPGGPGPATIRTGQLCVESVCVEHGPWGLVTAPQGRDLGRGLGGLAVHPALLPEGDLQLLAAWTRLVQGLTTLEMALSGSAGEMGWGWVCWL